MGFARQQFFVDGIGETEKQTDGKGIRSALVSLTDDAFRFLVAQRDKHAAIGSDAFFDGEASFAGHDRVGAFHAKGVKAGTAFVATVEPCTTMKPDGNGSWRNASSTPRSKSGGVDKTLCTRQFPPSVKTTTSVKVPPMSMPTNILPSPPHDIAEILGRTGEGMRRQTLAG
jgi:hypothetical protein